MDYHVDWPPRIVDQLLDFHRTAAAGTWQDTAALNRALDEIESALLRTPLSSGESRAGQDRVIFVPPILVEYIVFEEERSVLVTRVVYSRGKRP